MTAQGIACAILKSVHLLKFAEEIPPSRPPLAVVHMTSTHEKAFSHVIHKLQNAFCLDTLSVSMLLLEKAS